MIVCVCPKGHTQTVLLLKSLYLPVYILYVLFAFYCSCRETEDFRETSGQNAGPSS